MFISHNSDKTYIEGQDGTTWDNVPDNISSLEVSTFGGEIITIPKCDKYFYSTEAVSAVSVGGQLNNSHPPVITAKLVGGIINGNAIFIRIDTRGHIKIQYLKEQDLPFASSAYKKSI